MAKRTRSVSQRERIKERLRKQISEGKGPGRRSQKR